MERDAALAAPAGAAPQRQPASRAAGPGAGRAGRSGPAVAGRGPTRLEAAEPLLERPHPLEDLLEPRTLAPGHRRRACHGDRPPAKVPAPPAACYLGPA